MLTPVRAEWLVLSVARRKIRSRSNAARETGDSGDAGKGDFEAVWKTKLAHGGVQLLPSPNTSVQSATTHYGRLG